MYHQIRIKENTKLKKKSYTPHKDTEKMKVKDSER